jgi:hypothetical protein
VSVYVLSCACVVILFNHMFQKAIGAAFVRVYVYVRGKQVLVFLCVVVYWHSDVNVPRSKVTLDKFNCKTYTVSWRFVS